MKIKLEIIPFILVALLLALIYLMNKEHDEAIIKTVALSYQYGKQAQIDDNIKKGVMTDDDKWKDGFELARQL